MTADRPDPRFRGFDAVEPPEQWDDIVARSQRIDVALVPDAPARLRPTRVLALAASLILVVGLAVVLLADRGQQPGAKVSSLAGEPSSVPASTLDPDDPAGSTTLGVATDDGSGTTTVPGAGDGDGGSGSSGGSTGSGGGTGSGSGPITTPDGEVVATVAGGGSSGSSGDAPTTTAPGSGPTSTVATTVPPLTITAAGSPFGRSWNLGSMTDTGGNRPLDTDRSIVLDATTDGKVSLTVCNTLSGTADLVGGKLVVTLGPTTQLGCGSPLDEHEAWLARLLASSPTVNVTGNVLVLSNGTQRAEFDAIGG